MRPRTTTSTNGYLFDTETMNLSSTNGFLNNVWWSNFESYSQTGNYTGCTYNWQTPNSYDVDNTNNCSDSNDFGPVYFANGDYLFGPTFTNDSVFVSGDGTTAGSPSFGNPATSPQVPSPVKTADPNCLFVDNSNGMSGSDNNCANASSEVALSSPVGPVGPGSHCQLLRQSGRTPALDRRRPRHHRRSYGCLYAGPTQITLDPRSAVR